jgi:hypothetical protein
MRGIPNFTLHTPADLGVAMTQLFLMIDYFGS